MGLMIIFSLVTLLALFAVISSFKNKNFLGFIFAAGTTAVIGWFTVMTIIHHGFPVAH
ncbi:DUF2759 domain-containing protein [Bacillus sp. V5-8f]|uniref:DUF2759 domain-containing protein n=1 Tax=Bacillus sp. V5-8f TaxID=2053044 RepID=UPI000C78710B|nr:DUF2759 domain-containing protein [Bacillus sp. V5-8f]PLT34717.1 DUF2759 domain-containing protein [Bacillus sp. V5-8f]